MGFALVIGGIVAIICGIVLLIIGVAGSGKNFTLIGILVALLGIFSLLFGVFYSVSHTVSGFKNIFNEAYKIADSTSKAEQALMEEPETDWNSNATAGQESIDYLKSLVPDSVRPFVKKRYFRKTHELEFSRYPVSFPYAIHTNHYGGNSLFTDERALMDTRADSNGVTINKVLNVTHIVFDEKIILLKTSDYDFNSNTNTGAPKFFLFEFGKDGLFEFKTERELTEAATKMGYTGSFDFYSIEEYGQRFRQNY